ncbi:hypothetical protein EFR57_00250 [Lactobacillus crispatus]|nr:hypothetical protein [Lactobacillus crispatus]
MSDSEINRFLDSLSYWQSINLYVVLAQTQMDYSFKEAKEEAVVNYTDSNKLKYLLEEAINSPNPKSLKE